MPTFSRWMPPPAPPRTPWLGRLVLGALILAAAWFVARHPVAIVLIIGLVAVSWAIRQADQRAFRRLAADRSGEGLCTFARALGRRADPRIIRATYDELAPVVAFRGGQLPLRAMDRLIADLRLSADGLDDVVEAIATRAQRVFAETRANPYYGRVRTVADIVWFVQHQPRRAT